MDTMEKLPQEGEQSYKITKKLRRSCDECGEPAHFKHTWLLKGTRTNPASKAYGRDDCSWCADDCSFSCHKCKDKMQPPEGFVRCSVFSAGERFAHMFLYEQEVKIGDEAEIKLNDLLG